MQHLYIHPENPQQRLINQAVGMLQKGGVIVYPNDTNYSFACKLGEKSAVDRIRQLRQLDQEHQFTLLCKDLSEIATYAKISNAHFRVLKANTPAPITYILEATKEVPKRLMHPKRKTIGIRVPENTLTQMLLDTLGEPLLTTTLIMPNDDRPLDDPFDIADKLEHGIDALLDAGVTTTITSSIVDMSSEHIELIRAGAGDTSFVD